MSQGYDGVPCVGITGTLYSDKQDHRFELSLATIEAWRDQNLPIVVVDASPQTQGSEYGWTAAAYRQRGARVLPSNISGIASQRQQGARYALEAGAERFITLEPEKVSVVTYAERIADELHLNDVVVIGRTVVAQESLPPVQRRTERLAGWILEQSCGMPYDSLAGPRGYSALGAQHLLEYPSHRPGMNNWLYLYTTVLAAQAADQATSGLQLDLIHPASMVNEETGNPQFDRKRYEQFRLQLDYMLRTDNLLETRLISDTVLTCLQSLPNEPTNQEYRTALSRLESKLIDHGYTPA